MNVLRLRYKLLLVVGITLIVVFGAIAYFTSTAGERAILRDHERALHKMTDSVAKALESMMVESHAEIMPEFSARLGKMKDVRNFQILRTDGSVAFNDNLTINAVNEKLKSDAFVPHSHATTAVGLPSDSPALLRALNTQKEVAFEVGEGESRVLEFLDPILNDSRCQRCHDAAPVRGIIRVTSPLDRIDREVDELRLRSLLLLTVALIGTMLVTGYMLGRSVVKPIERVTRAMAKISTGDFSERIDTSGDDEVAQMARSFNQMTAEIRDGHLILERERQKLTTIIRGAREAIVVTNASGDVVLVNTAACELLGKSEKAIREGGFLGLFDNTSLMEDLLTRPEGQRGEVVQYGHLALQVSAARITSDDGAPLGSAALIRDVTLEQHMLIELRRISITDALTGIFNRRHLDTSLINELDRSKRSGEPLSLILFDIDHFKRFNDTYGHDQGDRVLTVVGATLKAALRTYDIPCRYGGEEFCIVLPKTTVEIAFAVAERLREKIAATVVDNLQVTISLGVSTNADWPQATPASLLESADHALYQAKDSGRNCSRRGVPLLVATAA